MPPNDPAETGRIVRAIRKKLGLTLAEVARECGCTVSFLSKLENGRTAPSLNTLHRIATSLGVNIGTLAPQENSGARRIVRANGRTTLDAPLIRRGDGIKLEMISSQSDGELFQVNLHHVAPGGRSDGQIVHAGNEFIYILNGEIDLHLADDVIRLGEGDAAFFRSTEPHGYANPGEAPCVILWLNSPPTY
jgi:transcriptional regulator with XRE-family HTH domain